MPYDDRAEVEEILREVRRATAPVVERDLQLTRARFACTGHSEKTELRRGLAMIYVVPFALGLLGALIEAAWVGWAG